MVAGLEIGIRTVTLPFECLSYLTSGGHLMIEMIQGINITFRVSITFIVFNLQTLFLADLLTLSPKQT
jgi:hypothetical protein